MDRRRYPTPEKEAYQWHTNALLGVYGDEVLVHPDDPQCGWYKRRLVKKGPFVATRIWLESDTDMITGELRGDEVLKCEVDGKSEDPFEQWSYLCHHPIDEAEFDHLTATRAWAMAHCPNHPLADPRKPIDWSAAPIPQFSKGQTK